MADEWKATVLVAYPLTLADMVNSVGSSSGAPFRLALSGGSPLAPRIKRGLHAEATGVDTPVIDGLIAIASAMLGQDFRADGRDLERLGLGGLGTEELHKFGETGEVPDGSGK